jgi:hypothetical protein
MPAGLPNVKEASPVAAQYLWRTALQRKSSATRTSARLISVSDGRDSRVLTEVKSPIGAASYKMKENDSASSGARP